MEKRKWPWKRKSPDKSPGETESSGSMSSYSERFSDEQDAAKSSPNHETQSPEVTSKAVCKENIDDVDSPKQKEISDSVKNLTDQLSVALLNVRAKEDMVKQHSKVAEEAIAGWEKAENEVGLLKQQLGNTVQQKSALEDRVSHLDGALKECVRQLRQGREEQERKIRDAVEEKTRDWESTKVDLERQLLELQSKAEAAQSESPKVDPSLGKKLESLKRANAALRLELHAQYRELEARTIERDLSTQTAETASKQHLESIKKMAKLEAECRRLRVMSCKPSLVNVYKSIAASTISIESLTDTQSDNGEQLNAVDIDIRKTERNKCEPSCSDSWASALMVELNQLGNEKAVGSNLPSSLELDLMDDFLEMERLASLPEANTGKCHQEPEASSRPTSEESAMITELETLLHERSLMKEKLGEMEEAKIKLEEKLKQMEVEKDEMEERLEMMEIERAEVNQMLAKMETENSELGQTLMKMESEKVEMGEKLMKLEAENNELETALSQSQHSVDISQSRIKEAEMKLEKLQNELTMATESKLRIESQLISMEVESLTTSAEVGMLESDIQKERASALALTVKCQELEEQLSMIKQDEKQSEIPKNELKIKQEDLAVAAGKLAECQKTIASLGNQLKSLAALEDFLIDTTQLPEFTSSELLNITRDGEVLCKHSYGTISPKRDSDYSKEVDDNSEPSMSKNEDDSPPSSSSSSTSSCVIANHVVSSEKKSKWLCKVFLSNKEWNKTRNLVRNGYGV